MASWKTIDRRRSCRALIPQGGVPVVCKRASQILLSKGNALSEHGLFVCTTKPFPVGSVLTLSIGLPGEDAQVRGKVRHTNASGMGIEFSLLDMESRLLLLDLIATGSDYPEFTATSKNLTRDSRAPFEPSYNS